MYPWRGTGQAQGRAVRVDFRPVFADAARAMATGRRPLTRRQREILQLLAQGMENKEIAAYLVVRDATVRTHVSNILRKLQLANRVQATLYALRTGITSLEDEPPDIR
jgi:DNA-binding NarL/FixJ family response regulator